jgi:hypothetical protein
MIIMKQENYFMNNFRSAKNDTVNIYEATISYWLCLA